MGGQYAEPGAELDGLVRRVIGAAIEVHRALGPGFNESVYEEAMGVELELRRVPFTRQHPIDLQYKGVAVGAGRLDFLIDARLVVELKATDRLAEVHIAQTLSYLRATRLSLALLINFNVPALRRGLRRIIHTPPTSAPPPVIKRKE